MFGGRMPYMSEDNWLTLEERRTARLQNENGEEDDEDSINLEARFERSDAGIPVGPVESLPGSRARNGLAHFAPSAPNFHMDEAECIITPSRDRPSTPRPTTVAPSALSRRPSGLRHSELADSSNSHTPEAGPSIQSKAWHAVQVARHAQTEEDARLALQLARELELEAFPDDVNDHEASEDDYLGNLFLSAGNSPENMLSDNHSDEADDEHGTLEGDPSPESHTNSPSRVRRPSSETTSVPEQTRSSRHPRQKLLHNHPPGAPKDWGIDLVSLKARRRQKTARRKMVERHSRRRNTKVYRPSDIVTVQIPKKDRLSGHGDRRMYARVLQAKRNTYQLQTKHGILSRWYHARDLAGIERPLATSVGQTIPNTRNKISLRAAARNKVDTEYRPISCRCKVSCVKGNCSCKNEDVDCSVFCHGGKWDCGRLAAGAAFHDRARKPINKGKERAVDTDEDMDNEEVDD